MQLANACSHALVDMDVHRKLVLGTLIVIIHLGFDLDLAKPARR